MSKSTFCAIVMALLAGSGTALAASAPPAGWPANLRWDLVPKWIVWGNGKATISWPPNSGRAAAPGPETLTPGRQMDRFGSGFGSFFSPRGESYDGRAVPYVCRQMDYRVYVVDKPIPVKTCKAAAWFGEPGGATQYQTPKSARDLVADGSIEVMSYDPAGSSGPAAQCGGP